MEIGLQNTLQVLSILLQLSWSLYQPIVPPSTPFSRVLEKGEWWPPPSEIRESPLLRHFAHRGGEAFTWRASQRNCTRNPMGVGGGRSGGRGEEVECSHER